MPWQDSGPRSQRAKDPGDIYSSLLYGTEGAAAGGAGSELVISTLRVLVISARTVFVSPSHFRRWTMPSCLGPWLCPTLNECRIHAK